LSKTVETKKVYYYEVNNNTYNIDGSKFSHITIDEEVAMIDPDYRLATESDLDYFSCVGVCYKDIVAETSDGCFVWFERSYKDALGDKDEYECGYVKVY
jgi:hypothetical protein